MGTSKVGSNLLESSRNDQKARKKLLTVKDYESSTDKRREDWGLHMLMVSKCMKEHGKEIGKKILCSLFIVNQTSRIKQ